MNKNIHILSLEDSIINYLNNNRFINKKNYLADLTNQFHIYNEDKFFNKFLYINKFFLQHESKNDFVKKYINLFSVLSKKNSSKLWWCSEHTTRNRFTSKLNLNLINFIEVKKILSKYNCDNIIFIVKNKSQKKYLEYFFKPSYKRINKFVYIFKSISNKILLTRSLIRLIFLNLILRTIFSRNLSLKEGTKEDIYLIKSHFYNSSVSTMGKYYDAFFPGLEKFLNRKVFYIVHVQENFFKSVYSLKKISKKNVMPYEYFIRLRDIFNAYFKILFIKNFNFDEATLYGVNISEPLELEYRMTCISLNNLLFYDSIREFIKKTKVKKAYFTFENISWENMFTLSFKDHSKETELIGYQHTVVPQAAMGMFLGKYEGQLRPLPSKVITTGIESLKIINNYSQSKHYNLKAGPALRYQYLENLKIKKRKKVKNILVAVEGIPEAIRLIEEVAIQKKQLRNYNITIRTHKVLPWHKLKRYSSLKESHFKHFNISENVKLITDLKKNDLCIYWGSTVSLEAGYMGLPLLNFDDNPYYSYDPLFMIKKLKWVFNNGADIKKTIDKIDGLDSKLFKCNQKKIRNYISRYLTKVSEVKMRNFK